MLNWLFDGGETSTIYVLSTVNAGYFRNMMVVPESVATPAADVHSRTTPIHYHNLALL
jgi:hypothetical protein